MLLHRTSTAVGSAARTNRSTPVGGGLEQNWRYYPPKDMLYLNSEYNGNGCLVGLDNAAATSSQPTVSARGASDAPKVCVFGASVRVFERFAPLLAALRERHERLDFVLMAEHPERRASIEERFPSTTVLAPPGGLNRRTTSVIRRLPARRLPAGGLKIQCFFALDGLEHVDRAFVAALRRRVVPIVAIDVSGSGIASEVTGGAFKRRRWHRQVDHFVVGEAAKRQRLYACGVAADKVEVVEGLTEPNGIRPQAVSRVAEIVTPFLAQHRNLMRSQRRRAGLSLDGLIARAMEGVAIRRLLWWWVQRMESVEELRSALREPRTILCLGNGPSSENPALKEMAHDSLFRVNYRWLERGFLVEPDIVFTGSDKALAAVRGAIFGLSSMEIETMLLRKWLLRRPLRRLTYFSPERAGVLPANAGRAFNPTNGVIMLATAVALQPRRLIVGGIDLFQDPKGAYPGDVMTPNAYAAAHERSMELRLILEILARYRGELVIVGDILRRHWEDREPTRRDQAGVSGRDAPGTDCLWDGPCNFKV